MAPTLPLNEMTLAEKLQVMETLWDDLSRNQDSLPSPAWHEDVLAERQKRIDQGEARYLSWEEAQAEIQRRIGT